MGKNKSTYDPIAFCENYICGKNLVLKLRTKIISASQISVFFNRQYLINGLTSDSDFLHVGRHE